MYYCKPGDILLVKPVYEPRVRKLLIKFSGRSYATALTSRTHEFYHIYEDELVMALEASVPPFYQSDLVRCLFNEKILHILRRDLQKIAGINNGKIKIRKGSLFDYKGYSIKEPHSGLGQQKINLAHGVNCAGAMGAGIATEFKSRYKEMYHEYKDLCKKIK